MVGWHHWLNGREFDDGQGGLACCSPRGHKELDTTEWLNWTELNWTDWLMLLNIFLCAYWSFVYPLCGLPFLKFLLYKWENKGTGRKWEFTRVTAGGNSPSVLEKKFWNTGMQKLRGSTPDNKINYKLFAFTTDSYLQVTETQLYLWLNESNGILPYLSEKLRAISPSGMSGFSCLKIASEI